MSLINKIVGLSTNEGYRKTALALREDPKTLEISDDEKRRAYFIGGALAARRHLEIGDAVVEAINQMKEPSSYANLWPFLTPSEPIWIEQTKAVDNKIERTGHLILPVTNAQGFAVTTVRESHGPSGDPQLSFSAQACFRNHGDQDFHISDVRGLKDGADKERRLANLHLKGKAIGFLMLLLNSESSPLSIQQSREDFSKLNKKRAMAGKPALRSLRPILVDVSKFGTEEKAAIREAEHDAEQVKRICVEHLVGSHFKTINVGDPPVPKLYRIGTYKRYDGSPKGSIVDLPRAVRLERSRPTSRHKVRGPDGPQLL